MAKLNSSYIYNVGSRDPAKPQIVYYNGERRRQLSPAGKVERFVNLQGSVVQVPLVPPGVPPTPEAVAQKRARMHLLKTTDGDVQGFIEHGRCPLKHGTRELSETIAEEFSKMPANLQTPCREDPVTWRKTSKGIEYLDSCPHVQWLIQERRAVHKAKVEARMKRQKNLHEIEQAKLAAAEQQAKDTRALLEKVVDRMERTTAPKKAPTE